MTKRTVILLLILTAIGAYVARPRADIVHTPALNVFPAIAFGALPTIANGAVFYCSDCTVTTAASCPGTQASCVCAGSGTGAFARRAAGAWYCTP